MAKIEFEAKTDRELLVIVAQTVNNMEDKIATVSEHLILHQAQIHNLESQSPYCPEHQNCIQRLTALEALEPNIGKSGMNWLTKWWAWPIAFTVAIGLWLYRLFR